MKYIQLNENGDFFRHAPNVVQPWDENNYCTPEALAKDGKAGQFFVVEMSETERPQHDLMTQKVIESEPLNSNGGWLQQWKVVALSSEEVEANRLALVPQEVTMAQCRLALYDKHGIDTDEQFFALADILPEADRARARLELRTRPTVRYDNQLVIAFCAAKGWDRDELFVYGAMQ